MINGVFSSATNPSQSLNFLGQDGGISVARAGATATRVNSSGFIEIVAADTPRIDYDPVSFSPRGLLVEGSLQNLFFRSQEFDIVAWSKTNCSVSADVETSPSNDATADKFVESLDVSNTVHRLSQNVSFVSGERFSISVYVKAGERSKIRFSANNFAVFPAGADFDISAGSVLDAISGDAKIVNAGNGYYRISISAVAASTASIPVNIILLNDAGAFSYIGDGSSGLYLWGAQAEPGFVSSYVPTSDTRPTRNADNVTIDNFASFWRAGSGAALVRAQQSAVSGIRPLIQFDDATANNIIALRGNAANPELYVRTGGVDQAQIDAGTIAANTSYRLAGAWAENSCAASLNSGTPVLDGVATIPTVTQARLGSDGTNYLNGHIEAIEYYDERVPNSGLQVVSSAAGYQSIIGSVFRDAIIS